MRYQMTVRGVKIELSHVITPERFGKELRRGTKGDYDFPTIITGKPRRGKSVLAIQIARGFSKRYSHEECMTYSDNQFKHAIENFRDMPIVVDEAVKMFLASNATAGRTKEAIIALNVCGNQHNQILFVLPFLSDLVKSIREKRAQYWIYIIARGLGVIFKSNDGLAETDDFWQPKLLQQKLKLYRNRYGEVLGTIYAVQEMPTFRNFIVWDNLEKEDYDTYEKIKDSKKYDDDSIEVENVIIRKSKENMAIDLLISLMKLSNGRSTKQFRDTRAICASLLGVSEGTLRSKLRQRALVEGVIQGKSEEKKSRVSEENKFQDTRTIHEKKEDIREEERSVKIEELIDLDDEVEEVEDA